MSAVFTENELALLLAFYLQKRDLGSADMNRLQKEILDLPENRSRNQPSESFRTPEGLSRAVRRFGAFESPPTASIEGGRTAYRAVWDRYANDPEALDARLLELVDPDEDIVAPSRQPRFGEIEGIPVGTVFSDRAALSRAGVHRPTQAGIAGSSKVGADSIVVSGGYEDDDDRGGTISYTGHGGKDPKTGRQTKDQELHRGNLALAISCDQGIPVRVIRGPDPKSEWAPISGYRYDGLFSVDSYSRVRGRSGFFIWRFLLVRLESGFLEPPRDDAKDGREEIDAPKVLYASVQRRIRNTAVAQRVKELHDFTCQVCGIRINLETGAYAEGAHIRALGKPHHGPDVSSNVLCLCPNDHVLFDKGVLVIEDDLSVWNRLENSSQGELREDPRHPIDLKMLAYHRSLHE